MEILWYNKSEILLYSCKCNKGGTINNNYYSFVYENSTT